VNGRAGDTRKCLNTLRKEERIPTSALLEIRVRPEGKHRVAQRDTSDANSAFCTADSSGTLFAHLKGQLFLRR